VALRYE